MVCPTCDRQICRPSRRKDAEDEFMFKLGLRPWRCEQCQARFYAWRVPASRVFYAHCERCGNLALDQIAPSELPDGAFRLFKLLFHIRAYRCDPGRHRFFSVLPARRMTRGTPDTVNARPAEPNKTPDAVRAPAVQAPVLALEQAPARPMAQVAARPVEQFDAQLFPAMTLGAWIPPAECPEAFEHAASLQSSTPVTTERPHQNGKKPVVHLSQVSMTPHKNGKRPATHVSRPKKTKG
jgi:hypothetical protein